MSAKLFISLICVTNLISAGVYAADDGTYLTLSVAEVSYEEDDFPDLKPTALIAKFGKIYPSGWGVEGRIGGSLDSDSVEFQPSPINSEVGVELDLLYGIYLVAQAKLGNNISVFAVAGANALELTREVDQGTLPGIEEIEETGVAFGAGINFGGSNDTQFSIEFMSYIDDDDITISTASLGLLF